jgi:hypothetical protein
MKLDYRVITCKKYSVHLLSRKKTSVSNDRIYVFCYCDKTVENNDAPLCYDGPANVTAD